MYATLVHTSTTTTNITTSADHHPEEQPKAFSYPRAPTTLVVRTISNCRAAVSRVDHRISTMNRRDRRCYARALASAPSSFPSWVAVMVHER